MTARIPSLFVSHGAPSFAVEDGPAHRFLKAHGLGATRPKAILIASAHNMASGGPVVGADPAPETVYDFGGFGPELYEIRYPAQGSAEIAHAAADLLRGAGFAPLTAQNRGLDHGAWVPLSLMAPAGEIPVVTLSIDPRRGADWHMGLGRALSPLAEEGVLILGSGGITHNLREFVYGRYGHDAAPPAWVGAFRDWLHEAVTDGRWDDVARALEIGPEAKRNHPHTEHFLPFYVALGAASGQPRGERLHASETYGVLAMDVYAFH